MIECAKAGEIVPYQIQVIGAEVVSAAWEVSAGAAIMAQADLPAATTVLVSFPAAGRFRLAGTVTLTNGARLIGVAQVEVKIP